MRNEERGESFMEITRERRYHSEGEKVGTIRQRYCPMVDMIG